MLHGLGGIGKSTLAAQIAARVSRLAPERVVTVLSGEISAASLVAQPADTDLVVLDDFGDNLAGEQSPPTIRDPALAAVLAAWSGKLLIACDTPFSLPKARPGRFVFRRLGPLTRTGAGELALSLPALRQVAEIQRDLAWRLTGATRGPWRAWTRCWPPALASRTLPTALPWPCRTGPASGRPGPSRPSYR